MFVENHSAAWTPSCFFYVTISQLNSNTPGGSWNNVVGWTWTVDYPLRAKHTSSWRTPMKIRTFIIFYCSLQANLNIQNEFNVMFFFPFVFLERDNGPSQIHTHLQRVLKVFPTDFASRKFVLWKQWTNLRRRTLSVTYTVDAHKSRSRADLHTCTYIDVSSVLARTKKQTFSVNITGKTIVFLDSCSAQGRYLPIPYNFCDRVSRTSAKEASVESICEKLNIHPWSWKWKVPEETLWREIYWCFLGAKEEKKIRETLQGEQRSWSVNRCSKVERRPRMSSCICTRLCCVSCIFF